MSYSAILTTREITEQLTALGVEPGMTLLVHSSLRRIAGDDTWIAGGPQAVVEALEAALTPEGTLVMPTHSTDWSDPALWVNPPIPRDWWPIVRAEMPAYRPDLTPTRMMGAIVDTFRGQSGVLRSSHPAHSFAARGRHAAQITADHSLEDSLGERSPLGRIYDLDGHVLLLGVGHENNTSLHLAEARADWGAGNRLLESSAMLVDGQRQWVTYRMVDGDSADFPALGADFEEIFPAQIGLVGRATARLMRQRDLVDFGQTWIDRHRPA
jgi:aminoglycoside 3-N-acetyltransferase